MCVLVCCVNMYGCACHVVLKCVIMWCVVMCSVVFTYVVCCGVTVNGLCNVMVVLY